MVINLFGIIEAYWYRYLHIVFLCFLSEPERAKKQESIKK